MKTDLNPETVISMPNRKLLKSVRTADFQRFSYYSSYYGSATSEGGGEGAHFHCSFLKIEESVLILEKNALIVFTYGLILMQNALSRVSGK